MIIHLSEFPTNPWPYVRDKSRYHFPRSLSSHRRCHFVKVFSLKWPVMEFPADFALQFSLCSAASRDCVSYHKFSRGGHCTLCRRDTQCTRSLYRYKWVCQLFNVKPGFKPQVRHQNKIQSVFCRRFSPGRFRAKTLRVNKIAMKTFSKNLSFGVENCRSQRLYI